MRLFRRQAALPGTPVDSPRAHLRTATDGRDVLFNSPDGWEVDAPWLWWTGPAGGDGTGGPFGNPLTPDNPWVARASTLAAVNRCTSIICDTVAGLPWEVRRGAYETLATPAWIADPQLLRPDARIADPSSLWDVRLSGREFWAQWIVSALWYGDGYVYVPVRDESGAPRPPLWQFNPGEVTIEGGRYIVGDTVLAPNSILHLRGMLPYDTLHGRGVLTVCGGELGIAATVRDYTAGVFRSGVPAGYLKSTAPSMSQEQADALKAAWLAQHGGARRSIAVLNATTDFTPVSISPVDAQLSSAREWSLRDTANAFNVPAWYLGVPGDSGTYSNIESRHIELAKLSLMPWSDRVEAVLSSQLPLGTNLVVNYAGLMRGDTATRFAAYKNALDAGWLDDDEVRVLEGLAPRSNGGGVA